MGVSENGLYHVVPSKHQKRQFHRESDDKETRRILAVPWSDKPEWISYMIIPNLQSWWLSPISFNSNRHTPIMVYPMHSNYIPMSPLYIYSFFFRIHDPKPSRRHPLTCSERPVFRGPRVKDQQFQNLELTCKKSWDLEISQQKIWVLTF